MTHYPPPPPPGTHVPCSFPQPGAGASVVSRRLFGASARAIRSWPVRRVVAVWLLAAVAAGSVSASPAAALQANTDYDTDNDGLIEIDSATKLNAVRWDLDGNGTVATGDQTNYSNAFPNAVSGMGCPNTGCTGYELTAKIDLNVSPHNTGQRWNPIGDTTSTGVYAATFEGNGHTIANLMIDAAAGDDELGLFHELGSDARVRNLGLTDASIVATASTTDSARFVGVLAGANDGGEVVAVHSTGTVTCAAPTGTDGCSRFGGLVGWNNGKIRRSHSAVDISANVADIDFHTAGGLVGANNVVAADNTGGIIEASYATGDVAGDGLVGGLVGANLGNVITSYSTGSATATGDKAGGLVGSNTGKVTASYSTGSVTAHDAAGGLVGSNGGTVTASYSIGSVTATRQHDEVAVGGLAGSNGGTVTASYYNRETSGQSDAGKGTGKTTAELVTPTGYSGIYANWNVDVDNADTDNNPSTGVDDPWRFGTADQYPGLEVNGKVHRPDSGRGVGPVGPVGPIGPIRPRPVRSVVDFELDTGRGIRSLHDDNAAASGIWSDGDSLWVLDAAAGQVFVYGLANGQRRTGSEFELDTANASPVGLSSDGETLWVLDSAANRLFAYSLADGGRLPGRDVALEGRFGSPRAVWSGGGSHYVVSNPLAVYDAATGALAGSWELDYRNRRPAGAWSDGVTLWVSNHPRTKMFAYRLPQLDGAEPDGSGPASEAGRLVRVRDEEFNLLSVVGNKSPAGLWSDGETMYVADSDDSRVYAYNMPDRIDARLASLSLSGVDIGRFSPAVADYSGTAAAGVRLTTVTAEAAQPDARVVIEPADLKRAWGHQARVFNGAEVAVTVTSPDGSRSRVYRVHISAPPQGRFIDDDASVHAGAVEAVAAAGIMAGCNPPEDDRFCPDRPVTRAEIASFLVRALDLAPAERPAGFTDIDPQDVHADDIDAVAAAGIAAGCNPPEDDRFCPDRAITRAAMATFFVRAFDLAPARRPARFADVDRQGVHAADIDALYAAGITNGCAAWRYCGDQPVTRAQMATFLARALDLPDP